MKIQKYAFIEVERKKGASVLLNNGLDEEILQNLLIKALPSGNPIDKFYKLMTFNDVLYLSLLRVLPNDDYGLALIIDMNKELAEMNPIGFIDVIYELLGTIMIQKDDLPFEELNLEYKEIIPEYKEYKNFDSFIFSLLTQQKTIVVGEFIDLQKFMGTIFECTPLQLRHYLSLVGNASSITNEEVISLIPISDRILKALDKKKEDLTVLLLPLKSTYGLYSSHICKNIDSLFKQEKGENIKEEITKLFDLATESNKLEPIADFSKANKFELADAFLVMTMRANHFDIKMEKSILEDLKN